ncbi:hypothetical protein [Rathayibacter sp. AY1C4]|uniref:hypothetical protein n=1 Tax=Rathayibacter sp. AY1C4 TaxID=2080537 RepID=UPI0011AFE20E|nr:hypothetical protein [Rathayibacter sp. AY1C4]
MYGSTDLSVYSFETVRFKASLSSVDNNGFAWPATEKVVGEMRHLRNTVPIGDLCRLSESTPTQGIGSFLITTDTAATPIDYYMIYPTEVTPNNPEGTGDYDLNDLKMALYVQNKAGSCLVVSGNGINQGSSTCLVNYR